MELANFLVSPIPEVKDLAERAQRYKEEYEQSKITKEEYAELLNDLTDIKEITSEMADLEATREFWALVNVIKNIKFATSLFLP